MIEEVEQVEEKEPSLRDKLIEEADQFMDELITQKRTGVNLQVLESLGGQYGSDLDLLLENASIEQLNDALSFKGLKPKQEVSKVDSLIAKGKELNNKELKKENQIPAVSKSSKSSKVDICPGFPEIYSGVKVSFTLNKRRGGGQCVGVVLNIHLRGENKFVLIKTENGIVSKVPTSINVIQ